MHDLRTNFPQCLIGTDLQLDFLIYYSYRLGCKLIVAKEKYFFIQTRLDCLHSIGFGRCGL